MDLPQPTVQRSEAPSGGLVMHGMAGSRLRLSSLMLALVLAVLLPTLALGAVATWYAGAGQRRAAETALLDIVTSRALAVDREVAAVLAALEALALSPALQDPLPAGLNAPALYAHARPVAERFGATIEVITGEGTRLLSTSQPVDAALSRVVPGPTTRLALETGRPQVGGLVRGISTGRLVVPIAVPVPGHAGRLVVRASLVPERLQHLLDLGTLPAGVLAWIADARGARVTQPEGGEAALPSSEVGEPRAALHASGGEVRRDATGKPDRRIYAARGLATVPGWTVIVAQPMNQFDAGWRSPLLALVAGGGLVLLLCGALAMVMARWILEPLRGLRQHALSVAAAEGRSADIRLAAADIPPTPILELEALRQGFTEAESALAAREARLAESEARFRDMADSAPVMLWVTDATGRNTFLSRSWREFTGQAPGRRWMDGVHPDDIEAARAAFQAAFTARSAFRKEYRVRRADGAWRWVIDAAAPRFGPDGAYLGHIGSIMDITERRAAEVALMAAERRAQQEKARFRLLAEAMPQLVWSTLPDGWCDYLNARWYAHTGQAPGAAEGHGWAEALHPDDRAMVAARWRHALETGEAFEVEHRLRGADGTYHSFLVRSLPLRDEETGQILRWLGTCTDISEIVAARESRDVQAAELERLVAERTAALRESEARLSQAARMEALGRLAGGVAHDFNNVLQAVQGGVALAAKRLARDPEGARRFLSLAADATERGAAVTGRLLAFARRSELSVAPVEPGPLLAGLAEMLRHTLGPSVEVAADVAPGCPDLLTDAGQLDAVLVNLANNARDALPGGAGRVTLSARPEGDRQVRVTVSDDGEGMTPEVLARVTEPFFTTKPKGRGTGLGLAMARGFAEQSGGSLLIESRRGAGTAVSLLLPVATRAADAGRPDRAAATPASARTLELLVVDDEPGVRAVLATALADCGHRVAEAGDGASALSRLRGGPAVDALVTDLAMPGGMDGLALIEEARRHRPGLPALLVTGHVGDAPGQALERAASGGPFALMRKPVTPVAVDAQVAALLRRP